LKYRSDGKRSIKSSEQARRSTGIESGICSKYATGAQTDTIKMEIIKDIKIEWEGCTRAIIKSVDSDWQYVCDLQKKTSKKDEEGNFIYETLHSNIGFTDKTKPFDDLTDEEMDELLGKGDEFTPV